MNLGGFALLLAAVFASGSGAHTAAMPGAHTVAAPSATSNSQPSADPDPTLSPSGTTGTLTQAGPGTWQVKLLLDDSGAKCAGTAGAKASAAYRLQFTIPGAAASTSISGTAKSTPVSPPPPSGSSCETTIKFTGLNQVPVTATLDLDQGGASSAITLTVSRTVTLYYYLGLPAVVGGIMVIIMLLAALRYVKLYTVDGRRVRWRDHAWWVRPLSAAGAWSLNDSWATNITTMITLLATILGATTASSALFPGVALDRFVIVNIVAGGIVAVAPLAFGVFYAGWTRHNPGIMADASLALPQATAVQLASPAKLALARGTPVVPASGGRKNLRAAAVATVARSTVIQLPGSSTATLKAGTKAALPAGGRAALADRTALRLNRWWILRPSQRRVFPARTGVYLLAGASVRLGPATMRLPGDGSGVLAEDAVADLGPATVVRVATGPTGTVGRGTTVRLDKDASVRPLPHTLVTLTSTAPVTLPSGTKARIPRRAMARHGLPPWPARVMLAADTSATLETGASAFLADVSKAPAAIVEVPSGADVVLPGGGTITGAGDNQQGPVTVKVKKGHTVHIPPQTRISILAGAVVTIPGTADITVGTAGTLLVDCAGTGGGLTIPSDDVDSGKAPPSDASVAYPARIEAPAGAKVTVAGVADITLPAGTKSRASYRAEAELRTERSLQVPAGSSVLFGNLRMILGVAVLTMFGIGAEIGIAGVLAYGLSEASQPWRWGMLAVTGLVGLLTIAYAVTAIRAIADPRPGSTISATSGTSFTL
jgi:hypothetical protein